MEMEQLLSMGFPDKLATEALAVTGSKSTLKATKWILSHKSSSNNPTTCSPNPSPFQPKLDRFFNFNSSKDKEIESTTTTIPLSKHLKDRKSVV